MTDAEIIKALECCGKGFGNCEGCPYDDDNNDCVTNDGKTLIFQDCINLINRQKAEIEKNENIIRLADKAIARQGAEVERLQKAGQEAASCFTRMESLYKIKCKELEVAKAGAIKEFADQLDTYIMWHFPIDNPVVEGILAKLKDLAKEMTEWQKNDFKE